MSAFNECLASNEPELALKIDRQVALANGIAQTPTTFVDDVRIDGLPTPDELIEMIQADATRNGRTAGSSTGPVTTHDVQDRRYSVEPSLPAHFGHLAGILLSARLIAGRNGADKIRPEDLVLAIFEDPLIEGSGKPAAEVLGVPGSTYDKLKLEVQGSETPKDIQYGDLPLGAATQSILAEASRVAQAHQQELDGLHLLLVLSSNESPLRDKLVSVGITPEKIQQALQKIK